MRVDIQHVEKSQGLVFKKKFYGVTINVTFSEEEKAIINERKIQRIVVLDRPAPADVDAEKHANRGLAAKIATAALKGMDANHFHLTIGKLVSGPDTYFLDSVVDAKDYEESLREQLPKLKAHIMDSEQIEQKSDSFEL